MRFCCQLLALSIHCSMVFSTLLSLLGSRVTEPIRFAPEEPVVNDGTLGGRTSAYRQSRSSSSSKFIIGSKINTLKELLDELDILSHCNRTLDAPLIRRLLNESFKERGEPFSLALAKLYSRHTYLGSNCELAGTFPFHPVTEH